MLRRAQVIFTGRGALLGQPFPSGDTELGCFCTAPSARRKIVCTGTLQVEVLIKLAIKNMHETRLCYHLLLRLALLVRVSQLSLCFSSSRFCRWLRWPCCPQPKPSPARFAASCPSEVRPSNASPASHSHTSAASITNGVGSSHGNGYRDDLYGMLAADGNTVNMVGRQKTGDFTDPDNEGYPGATIDMVHDASHAAMEIERPNIVTVLVGTNDMALHIDVGNAVNRLRAMVQDILDAPPLTLVVVSSLCWLRERMLRI